MSFVTPVITELRERRIWPLAIVLLVGLVAVPVLLSRGAHHFPAPPPLAGLPTAAQAGDPAVTLQNSPADSKLAGRGRDPFAQQHGASSGAASSAAIVSTSPSGAKTGTGNSTGSTGTGSGATGGSSNSPPTSSTGGSSGSNPPSITPGLKPTPSPAGLTATESYHVTLAITNSTGGLDTIDPLERLSVLPSSKHPQLIELGVLQGGHRVLFAVQPGTVLAGPGTCTPGPIDCQILSLAQDQTEALSLRSSTGVAPVALFAITAIKADHDGSVAAADKARQQASAAGRKLLGKSTLDVLPLFQYQPSVGAVVDLRNLRVGGS